MKRYLVILTFIILMTGFQVKSGFGQVTSFTYQGSLANNGTPATGNFDFEFVLFGVAEGGSQLGGTNTRLNVAVSNGIFTVNLDFGDQYNDISRFLEIRVRTAGGGAFTPLAPRQQIRASPYSVRSNVANTAANAVLLDNIPPSGFIQNTTNPQTSTNFNIGGTGTANILNATTQFNIGGNRVFGISNIQNTFAGLNAGTSSGNTVGNTFFGNSAGQNNTTGGQNSLFGANAGKDTNGTGNSFFGYNAGLVNSTGNANSFFGNGAGDANTTAQNNSFFGNVSGGANTTGTQNSFFGSRSGLFNISGSDNAYFGYEAGLNSTSSFNSFFGSLAGRDTTTGNSNSFFGASAGLNNGEGSDNSFFGVNTGLNNTFGTGNSFFGRRAGRDNITGNNNTFIGTDAGRSNVLGDNNTAIGAGATLSGAGLNNATVIGAGATVTTSNTVVIGTGGNTVRLPGNVIPGLLTIGGSLGINFDQELQIGVNGDPHVCISGVAPPYNFILTRCSSSIRFKENVNSFGDGMELLKRLRPVTYNWKSSGKASIGFIAEEVNEVDTRLSEKEKDGEVFGVNFNSITALTVGVVQEQQKQIEAQQKQIDEQAEIIKQQREKLEKQQSELEALKKLVCSQNPTAEICKPQD